ncbi:MAG: SNF2-related protein [Caldilineaceae bacterium]|nr:SNF2-related protein [Caldilineaceae bacterium]
MLKYAQHRPHPIPKPVSKSLQLYPHQQEGCDRLLAAWPESRLLADEVGLGKTITASAAMQALQAQGKCQRVLILAPANVCIQWQEELAEKFNMKVPRLVKNYLHNVDGSEHAAVNPLNEPMLIASWHLMRQPTWRSRLLQGPDWDLVIVDEAHHARRRSPGSDLKSGIRRPNQFLELLEEVLPQIARTLWLLTATPVQLHLVELFDLLNVIKPDSEPQSSPLGSWFKFERFYTALAAPKSDRNWEALGMGVGETVPVQLDPRKYSELKPFLRRQLTGFGRPGRDAVQDADTLVKHELQEELLESIRQRSPGSRLMLRRTRRDADM